MIAYFLYNGLRTSCKEARLKSLDGGEVKARVVSPKVSLLRLETR